MAFFFLWFLLVVLDDVWDSAVWFGLSKFFPTSYSTRCRIILTTRLFSVARRPYPVHIHKKCFLDDEDSWNLLRKMVFTSPEESCSYQLEKIGKKIAKNCEGLPLAIVFVGELLSKAEKTVENWEKVAKDDNPLNIGVDDNTPISKSLYLSYDMLPQYLKPCFLYVGVFPQSYEISVSEVIRLWVVEGFLTPEKGKSKEEIAKLQLDDLISNSVVLVHEESSAFGKTKTCRIHVVFRNLCIGISHKKKFCYVVKKYPYSFPHGTNREQRMFIHNNVILGIEEMRRTMKSISSIHSLLCLGPYHSYPLQLYLSFTRLKVLHALRIRFYSFPREILELDRLKYLAITYDGEIPDSISKLWNLEVLIVGQHLRIKSLNAAAYLPVEIWNLKWLKHLQFMGLDLLDSCPNGRDDSDIALRHLSTLLGVGARSCTENVLARMRNLQKLGIQIELAPEEEETFSFLGNVAKKLPDLHTFKCAVLGFSSRVISQVPGFPRYIRKLTLSGCRFSWKCMTAISKLMWLEVLKLQCNAFSGSVWEPCGWSFHQLEFLLLEDLDVEVWEPSQYDFRRVMRLIIRHCYKLREIPSRFGAIQTLQLIEVEDCSPSVVTSAKQIQEIHKQDYRHPQVRIHSAWDD